MKIAFFIIALFLGWSSVAQDTFSIIALDPETREIGAAGATCVDGIAAFGGIQLLNQIIPGKGGVNAQASVCINPHINLDNAIAQMQNKRSPQEIIDWLYNNDACFAENYNPETRQYGIVDFAPDGTPRVAAFTGNQAFDYKGHRTGATYSIQGNILLGQEVLEAMENGFNNTDGTLAQKLMAAMQGANMAGADVRCLDRGTSSTSAFLRVYRPDDAMQNPYLDLSILEMPFGEEPIDSLQTLFDAFVLTGTTRTETHTARVYVYPNPSDTGFHFEVKGQTTHNPCLLTFYTLTGKQVFEKKVTTTSFDIDASIFENTPQILIYRLTDKDGRLLKADKVHLF